MKPSKTKTNRARRILKWLGGALLFFVLLIYFVYVLPFWGIPFNQSRHGRVPLTPPWALECWLWEDDSNTAAAVEELLEGYAKHDLPVRTVVLDSPWSTRYNDFNVDEKRYPNPQKFFSKLQTNGYRVVLWMTCMVNNFSKDTAIKKSPELYSKAQTNGYLADGEPMKWWKGVGGFIDYTNPDAMKWWRGMQQQMFDYGVDGWKLDGCDTFFSSKVGKVLVPFNRVESGWITTRQYMDHYARAEYQHGLTQNPEFATLIRAKDKKWSHPEGFAPLDAAPVTWVGDNQHTWSEKERGLEAAIRDILASAKIGYCVIGSDVGGYHGRSNPDDIRGASAALLENWKTNATANATNISNGEAAIPDAIAPVIYIRWAQFSTFCGLFLNGGHGERRLWKRSPAELEIIRKFSWLHTELVPYMYSHVALCHRGGLPLMRPQRDGKFHYLFGDDFLVVPIHENKTARSVSLPPGQWRYLFDDKNVFAGPVEVTREFPLDEFPVFIRDGAIVPLNVKRAYTGFGDKDSEDFRTWLIYPNAENEFTLFHPETHPKLEQTQVRTITGETLRIEFSGKHEPHLLRIHAAKKPKLVTLDGKSLSENSAWNFDATSQKLIVRTQEYRDGNYVVTW